MNFSDDKILRGIAEGFGDDKILSGVAEFLGISFPKPHQEKADFDDNDNDNDNWDESAFVVSHDDGDYAEEDYDDYDDYDYDDYDNKDDLVDFGPDRI